VQTQGDLNSTGKKKASSLNPIEHYSKPNFKSSTQMQQHKSDLLQILGI